MFCAGDIQVLASCPNLTFVNMEVTKVKGTTERLNVLLCLRTSPLFLERTSPPKESTKLPRMAHGLDDSIKNNYVIHVGDKEALEAALPGCSIIM